MTGKPLKNTIIHLSSILGAVIVFFVFLPELGETVKRTIYQVLSVLGIIFVFYSERILREIGFWRKILIQIFISLAVFGIILKWVPLGVWLSRPLLVPPSLENAQAILVLASGVTSSGEANYAGFQRIMHGFRLFREGRAGLLVISCGAFSNNGRYEVEWVASMTRLFNISSPSVELMERGTSTRTESSLAAGILFPRQIRRILLVTNGPHIFRAKKTFEKAGFEVLPAPVHTLENITGGWEGGLNLFKDAIHEWLGLALYSLRGDISW